MIYNKDGETLWYEGKLFAIGASVYANENSDYSGLFGRIIEIRTGNDRETENDTPDIYCEFDPPVLSAARKELEASFSTLYRSPKRIEELGLDFVIMGPDMLTSLPVPDQDYPKATLYIVTSHWASDGEYGSYEIPFTNQLDAKRQFHNDLRDEQKGGCLERWRTKTQFVEEETENSYECYLDGEYCENHFYIGMEQRSLAVSPDFLQSVTYLMAGVCNNDNHTNNEMESVYHG